MDPLNYSQIMDSIFSDYEAVLSRDFQPYRNHCFRVFNYMEYFFLSDRDAYVAAVLIPFHDLGIWTHKTMDYLQASCEEAESYVNKHKIEISRDTIHDVIKHHHKLTSATTELAEKLRKADLIDLSQGFIRYNLPKSLFKEIKKSYPYLGFHHRIYSKVMNYAWRHPLKPFPMLKA